MKENLTKKILLSLLLGGMITVAATSPFFLINIAKAYSKDKKYKNIDKRKIAQALSYLKRNRLMILKEKEDKILAELSEKGKRKIKEYQFDELKIEKPEIWDKKWRVVIFDIPDKKKLAREVLREKLKKLNFFQLQKSVWVHPYPCENEIQLIVEMFAITAYVNIILADKISNDVKAKYHFNLL